MVAALSDDTHVAAQKARYGIRRGLLTTALESAGYRIEHSEAGLYLWATRDGLDSDRPRDAVNDPFGEVSSGWSLVSQMADLGILVAPGSFYGAAGGRHVRIALTATDERVAAAVNRLA